MSSTSIRSSDHAGLSSTPERSCLLETSCEYAIRLASCRSTMIDPSTEMPPNKPFVLEYEYRAAVLPFDETDPDPSAFLPSGPTAT